MGVGGTFSGCSMIGAREGAAEPSSLREVATVFSGVAGWGKADSVVGRRATEALMRCLRTASMISFLTLTIETGVGFAFFHMKKLRFEPDFASSTDEIARAELFTRGV